MIDFTDFFGYIHDGAAPYPWQIRFAERCASSQPPPMVCAPTGAGKTAVVDGLLWALATQAHRPAAERTVGVRMVWAIDRRILVDEVHAHASTLARTFLAARNDSGHPLHEMADRLAVLSGAHPLIAARWRGGIPNDRELLGPMQPQIITCTVAQVGSRLLFRGYGVGRGSLALQAGLLACDTTICLDEAHLAGPFAETAQAIQADRKRNESTIELPRLSLITLTATPSDPPDDAIRLGNEDERALGSRLTAEKWATLDDSAKTEADRARRLVELTIEKVSSGAPTVACIANTVKQARNVFESLSRHFAKEGVDCILLIGPQRPADRERALTLAAPLFNREGPERPLVCVATQTFEVGLDADVAALVTESASAAALVQRLGRLNRRGEGVGRATIVRDEASWLYEEDEELAWKWLLSKRQDDGLVDVSVAALDRDTTRPEPLHAATAPALTTEVVELFAQTAPLPGRYQDPDVEPFLRGAESDPSLDVAICWRCDLCPEDTSMAGEQRRATLLELVPPDPRETLTLSIRAAKALLGGLHPSAGGRRPTSAAAALSDADIEGDAPTGDIPETWASDQHERPFVVIRRQEILPGTLDITATNSVRPSELEPGDTIILPTTAGGIDEFGLAPGTKGDAKDVAPDLQPPALDDDRDSTQDNGPVIDAVRISREVLEAATGTSDKVEREDWQETADRCRGVEQQAKAGDISGVPQLVRELAETWPDHQGLKLLNEIDAHAIRLEIRSAGTWINASGEPGQDEGEVPNQAAGAWVIIATPQRHRDEHLRTEAESPPTLADHAAAVGDRARAYARGAGLPPSLVAAIELAGRAHDHGKADPRIQSFFRGGAQAIGEPPLAKSVFGTRDPRSSRIAADLAGLPLRLHHELASTAILADAFAHDKSMGRDLDQDLALHLVATHHGRARPIPAVPAGGDTPRTFHCDAAGIAGTAHGDGIEHWMSGDQLRRFWSVLGRYGAWGAAYLEALLMLADRTVSWEGR